MPRRTAVEPLPRLVHEREQRAVSVLVEEGASGITRRRLLGTAAGTAGVALVGALIVPVASLGPVLDTGRLRRSPWAPGRRLVDELGAPLVAEAVAAGAMLTAFPEDAARDEPGSPLVVVRLPAALLRLPERRRGWAPDGILAFSKICPHAGCAISLFRYPRFQPSAPRPALVCPCHYSAFDPTTGGEVVFGPAGRALPQLPLRIGAGGALEAAGNFSSAVGPSWWGVRR